MQTRKSLGAIVLLALCFTFAAPASVFAGVFSVTPVRIYMTPKDRAVAVTITNEGDTEVVLQADLNAWSQKPDGTDEQVPTEDLILSPPSSSWQPVPGRLFGWRCSSPPMPAAS